MTTTQTDRRKDAGSTGTYDVYIEIDVDCEELLDACGLDYEPVHEDIMQNEVCISLSKDEYLQATEGFNWALLNEVDIGSELLNYELGEYVTKVTIYKPTGDVISFY